jgi:alkylhydroperoxidase family enzyme
MSTAGFLPAPEPTAEAQRVFDGDIADLGYVMNLSRLWAYQPGSLAAWRDLTQQVAAAGGLTFRQRGILISACAAARGDSYCSLAWGSRLAGETDAATAAGVLTGDDSKLTPAEQVLARWARTVARDPNGAGEADVRALREAGYRDAEIFAITLFVALRLAFSTVNDALGARPDAAYRSAAPAPVLDAVTFGRPIADAAAVTELGPWPNGAPHAPCPATRGPAGSAPPLSYLPWLLPGRQ